MKTHRFCLTQLQLLTHEPTKEKHPPCTSCGHHFADHAHSRYTTECTMPGCTCNGYRKPGQTPKHFTFTRPGQDTPQP